MVGRMTVVRPLSSVLMPVINVTEAITIAVVDLDVVVGVLSNPRKVTSSLRALLITVDGRRVLAVLAKTGCGACGTAMLDNSIEVRDIVQKRHAMPPKKKIDCCKVKAARGTVEYRSGYPGCTCCMPR